MFNSLLSMQNLSPEEQTAVMELKKRMDGSMDLEMFNDLSVFVRFLRARNLNINAAEEMLRKHIEWRKTYQIESILMDYTPKQVILNYAPFNIIGSDREGSPILYLHFGTVDTRGLLKSARIADGVKFCVQKLEKAVNMMQEQSLKEEKNIDKWIVIINFENLSLAVATHKESLILLGNLIAMYEGNYPERLKIAYFINASIYFTMGFAVVKHFISGPSLKKIHIFGTDGWRKELLKRIDPEVLPVFLGGKRTDPDGNPLCKTLINPGGPVPKSYYINKKGNTLANVPGISKLTVSRMSKTEITVNVTEPGSHLEWEFETTSRDIGFTLLYKQNQIDDCLEELIPNQRVDTNVSSETGMFKCEKPGIYIIQFDNSFSWIFQKEVYYKVSVVKDSLAIE